MKISSFLLRMKKFQTKVVEKLKTHLMFTQLFFFLKIVLFMR